MKEAAKCNEEDEVDDIPTESCRDEKESGEETCQNSNDEDHDRSFPMPPLKYARIMGCLPRDRELPSRALPIKITSSAIGRVVVRPSNYTDRNRESKKRSGSSRGEGTGENISNWTDYEDEEADMFFSKAYHVLALGFEDGKVRLIDALTGNSVLFGSSSGDGGAWFVNPMAAKRGHDSRNKIVALSFNSSSSYLSALNAYGDAAIFGPLLWGKQARRTQSTVSGEGQQKFGIFSSFAAKEADSTNSFERYCDFRPPFILVKPPSSTVRFTFADPQPFGSSILGGGSSGADQGYRPTCMALDPAYGRKKERTLIVGFHDGRLILSKLQGAAGIGSGITSLFGGGSSSNAAAGGITVKKIDIFQGTGVVSYSGNQTGIEAVTWRGRLIAWADSSGVRIYDIQSMSGITLIPRPKGARSSLYPTISSLKPSLLFERSNLLLIGWGDCLMTWLVHDVKSSFAVTEDGAPIKETRKKNITNTMAWDLDCVACSVVPIDEKHIAVLGLIPSPSSLADADESEKFTTCNAQCRDYSVAGGDNVLELQIINREDGKSISNDKLPLSEGAGLHQGNQRITAADAAEFSLLSSFASPRMDDAIEWEVCDGTEKHVVKKEIDMGSPSSVQKMSDLHMRWNICGDICSVGKEIQSEAINFDNLSVESNGSVLSDNYVFVLSEPIGDMLASTQTARTTPPIMAVVYSHDACLVQTRDVDDVISYTRSLGKPALALKHALAHRRYVKRHRLDQLVDEYFVALLGMGSSRGLKSLTFSRLKIAAESLPILLGGDSRMWQRWIFMFSRISGGLYAIREKIPVRDPDLPAFLFEMCLEKMLDEATYCFNKEVHDKNEKLYEQGNVGEKMADMFLETMRSWGPTSGLRRRVQFYRYCAQNHQWGLNWHSVSGGAVLAPFIQQAEKDLHRRISQTAFGVLAGTARHSSSSVQSNSIRQYTDSSKDSLFDVEHLIARLVVRLQQSEDGSFIADYSSNIFLGNRKGKLLLVVAALGELELMRERFDRALGYYLAIGSHLMIDSLSLLEEMAVQSVNSHFQNTFNSSIVRQPSKFDNYGHVLSLIELHQLSHVLLKRNFFFANEKDDAVAESPIIALIMLVGLARAGRFLMDNCSPPEGTVIQIDSDESATCKEGAPFSGANLPINLVAMQMKSLPKLLYWFLFQVFIHKPDIYVKFPTTTVPSVAITELHGIQFSLFIDYAEEKRAERSEWDSVPAVLAANRDTPFMAFLRATLYHGGVQADSVREKLEECRDGNADSPLFARELAFVIENFGKGTAGDARKILQLYLRGAKNLYMAVAFAERNTKHSSVLWDMLVEYCTMPDTTTGATQNGVLGAPFGSLLEAAAHTGSDLASLVSRIPEGMSIEGLRPKLIAAIADYRYKVKIHEQVDSMLMEDKLFVLREFSHLSRRGERMECKQKGVKTVENASRLSSLSKLGLLRSHRLNVSSRESHGFSLCIR